MDKYFAGFANIASWGEKQIQHGKTYGYVTSKFGRKLPIWEYQSDKRWIYQKGDRACVNYPIQGAATGDYMKIAMVRAVAAIKQAGLSDKIQLVMNIHDALEFYVHQSVKPQDAIAILRPAVVFEVPGWPAMKADWHIFRKWGSPTELDVRDDGEIYVAGQRLIEKPEITEDEDGDEVYELPEVDRATISEITAGSRQRRLSMTMSEMPTQQSWARFVALLDELPGSTLLRVQTPEGEISLPYAVGLAPEHVGAVSAVLGPVQLHYEADAADTSTVAAGLKL
jgi:hypothetical protein